MVAAAIDYDRAIAILQRGDAGARAALAADRGTPPEVLFYLARDGDIGVRRTVAENPATPGKADSLLSRDPNISVRCAIARKIVAEGLDERARRDMWRMGFTILETLMRDRVVRVRHILSDAFSSEPHAPHATVVGLARDRVEKVASPVLRGSPVLTDADMVAIIEDGAPGWAQDAIAGRDTVSPSVSGALIARGERRAVATVIANPRARLAPPVLDGLVDRSRTVLEWQEPLVARPGMSGGLLVTPAKFVAAPLLAALCGRDDIDADTARSMNKVLESRPDGPRVRAAAAPASAHPPVDMPGQGDGAAARARRLHEDDDLTDAAVALALEKRETAFVVEALALRAGLRAETVRRMIKVRSARTMVALSWKAGFSARFAMDLQRVIGAIPPPRLINAREGIDYALTPAEMQEQLALFE